MLQYGSSLRKWQFNRWPKDSFLLTLIGVIDSYTRHEGIALLIFTAVGGISGQFQASATLPPGKEPDEKEAGWPPPNRQSGHFGEEHTLFPQPGMEPIFFAFSVRGLSMSTTVVEHLKNN